jgi:ABC-2 type transport system permease protein
MTGVVTSELIKYRRTSTRKLLVLGPVGLVMSYSLVGLLGETETSWSLFLTVIYNWWPVLWVPTGAALLAALAVSNETRAGTWRILRARPTRPAALYAAKLVVLALHTLLSALLLAAAALLMGMLLVDEPVPWAPLILGALLPWLSALPLLAIQLWVATSLGLAGSVVLGVVGFLLGAMIAETAWWVCVPWSWPVRAVIPIMGFHANGVPLAPGDPLRDPAVVPQVILLSLLVFAVVGMLGAMRFGRKEAR